MDRSLRPCIASPIPRAAATSLRLCFALLLLPVLPARGEEYRVTTLAGPIGGPGYADGIGTAAQLSNPGGVAVAPDGSVYIADTGNHTIRRLDRTTGAVSTIAGVPGVRGAVDGSTGSAARFDRPSEIAFDATGNLYVADTNNATIRKVVPSTGQVTTVAGLAGSPGTADGVGTAARFRDPTGLASDGHGNLYIADADAYTIRKLVLATGQVTTVAGSPGLHGSADGAGTAARFFGPIGLATDAAGNVYVADTFNDLIRRLVPSTGEVTTLAGLAEQSGASDGTGTTARFYWPQGVTADGQGNLYVADSRNNSIRKLVLSTGQVTTAAGLPPSSGSADGVGTAARFNWPRCLVPDGSGSLLITDSWNGTLRRMELAGASVTTIAGQPPQRGSSDGSGTAARFSHPEGLAADDAGGLYVADSSNHTIRQVDLATGAVTTFAGAALQWGSADGTGTAARFGNPIGLELHAPGDLYVLDTGNHTVRKIVLPTGQVTTLAGSPGLSGTADGTGTEARFYSPRDLALDAFGNLYVADSHNHTIRKIVLSTGQVTTLAGSPGQSGSADGTGTAARFYFPYGLALDEGGDLFVADTWNDTIRRVDPATGAVITFAGQPGQVGSADGTGTAARFSYPYRVREAEPGVLYVADSSNCTLRKIETSSARVTILAGAPESCGGVDGVGELSRFNTPAGLAVAPDGRLVVADRDNHRIRLARPAASPAKYHTLAPCRVLDTRGGTVPIGGPPIPAGDSRVYRIVGNCSVPATAWAVSANVTVTGASTPGFLSLWQTGYPMPLTSTVNFKAGQVRANNAVLNLGASGSVSVFAGMGSGQVDVILDVTGWFE